MNMAQLDDITTSMPLLEANVYMAQRIAEDPELAENLSTIEVTELDQVVLYVIAGEDGIAYGACPVCQAYVMMVARKAELTYVDYCIKIVDPKKPLAEFKDISVKLPTLQYGPIVINDIDEVLNLLESIWPAHPIETKKAAALAATRDLLHRFAFFIKSVAQSNISLIKELNKIDSYLSKCGTKFLGGDTMGHADCILLPRLQHVRVAGKAFRDFDIPAELDHLWRYMAAGYEAEPFIKSCPSDQEIVAFWSRKNDVPKLAGDKRKAFSTKTTSKFSFEVEMATTNNLVDNNDSSPPSDSTRTDELNPRVENLTVEST